MTLSVSSRFGRHAHAARLAALVTWGWLALATHAHAQVPADPYNYSRTSSFTYFANGLLQSETVEPDSPASCVTTTYSYDAAGNKNGATSANCAGATGRALFTSRSSSTTYAAVPVQTILVADTAINVAIPSGLFATNLSNALNQAESRQYDPRFGAVINLTGPNALTTTFQVDDFGRKVKEVRADLTSTVTYYCVLVGRGLDTSANSAGCGTTTALSGQAIEIPADAVSYLQSELRDAAKVKMGPAGRVYSDRAGRKLREISEAFDGGGQPATRRYVVKDTQYNAQGVAVLSTQPYFFGADSSTVAGSADVGLTLTTYDALGRPIQLDVSDPEGNVPGVDFNGRGSRMSARSKITYTGLSTWTLNSKNLSRTEEKNVGGLVVRITDSYGGQLAHQHDALGNLVQTKDALQNLIQLSYDTRGRKVSMTDPDTGLWQYDYNALGELVWQQSPNQRASATATTMAYDRLGRMTSRVEPEYTSNWSFDTYISGAACDKGIGKLCESSTSHGINKKIVYDSWGRPASSRTTVTSGPSFATAIEYDGNTARVKTQTYPTGLKVSYTYTALGFVGLVKTVTAATLNPLPATAGGTAGSSVPLPADSLLWAAGTVNAWGQAETQSLGNGITTRAAFDAAAGRVISARAGAGTATNVLNHSYTWDSENNLKARTDANGDGNTGAVNESFAYDSLNRLTQYTVAAPQIPNLARSVTLIYNAIGNILYKSDVGNYDYAPFGNNGSTSNPRPHAVSQVVGATAGVINYSYDANGNMVAASGGKYRSVSYTSFNLPDSNTGVGGPGGSPRYTWQYDESHQRIRETRVSAQGTRTTWSQHPDNEGGLSFESETAPNGAVSNRHYLSVGGQTIVLVSLGALPTLGVGVTTPPLIPNIVLVKLEYWHKDHLGSLAATTDHTGVVTARYAYDPFGKRRYTNGRYDEFGALIVDWASDVNSGVDRGFTGHEHLDDIGIVHMNGRLYDPLIGRFMQGDPLIQAMANLQSYNRFSYCMNGVLNCTDPSGFSWWTNFRDKWLKPIVAIAVSYFLPGIIQGWMVASAGGSTSALVGLSGGTIFSSAATVTTGLGTFTSVAISGFVSGAITGGSFSSGIQGAFTQGLFFGAGDLISGTGAFAGSGAISSSVAQVAIHGVVGCVTSAAGGGKCGAGALSAAFSKIAVVNGWSGSDKFSGTVVSAVVGGTGSVLGGGKFANGAVTGAFSYLLNECMHTRMCGSDSTRVAVTGNKVTRGMAHSEIQITGGYDFTVLEGQPSYLGLGNLEGRSNGANSGDAFSIDLPLPANMTTGELALALKSAAGLYRDNLPYGYPKQFGLLGSNELSIGDYNSNSYVSGVLKSVYGYSLSIVPDVAARNGWRLPGWSKPIPLTRP